MRHFIDLINEAQQEHTCSCVQIVSQIDEAVGTEDAIQHLMTKYAEFNAAYFDGALPTIPISWNTMKTASAAVMFSATMQNRRKVPNIDSIKMVFSKKYQRTVEQLEPLLLHEMIHVYVIAVLNDADEHHGAIFLRKLRSVKEASGIDVPLTDTAQGLELTDQEAKPIGVILRRDRENGEVCYAMFPAKTLADKTADLEAMLDRYYRDDIEARIVTSPLWWEKSNRSRLQRNINYKTTYYRPKPEEIEDLMANSKLIWSGQGRSKSR